MRIFVSTTVVTITLLFLYLCPISVYAWCPDKNIKQRSNEVVLPLKAKKGEDARISSSFTAGCPVSRSFARNRIELSSDVSSKGGRSFGWLEGLEQMKVEKKYKGNKNLKYLYWEDLKNIPKNLVNIKCTALFWRAVSDIVLDKEHDTYAIALPGVEPIVARRLLDIFEWKNENANFTQLPAVRASLDQDVVSMPVIILNWKNEELDEKYEELHASKKEDANIVELRTKAWVKRVLVDLGVCPFTKSDTKSGQGLSDFGIPVANIAYHCSHASVATLSQLMADCWEAISDMVEAGPSGVNGISSILLSAYNFDEDFEFWSEKVFPMLEAGTVAIGAETQIGVVCFHPKYATPNGKGWPGFGQMHSVIRLRSWINEQDKFLSDSLTDDEVAAGGAWQRRTPHAVVNVLWADQLAVAEGRRRTGSLYTRNIKILVGEGGIGLGQLARDLDLERTMSSIDITSRAEKGD